MSANMKRGPKHAVFVFTKPAFRANLNLIHMCSLPNFLKNQRSVGLLLLMLLSLVWPTFLRAQEASPFVINEFLANNSANLADEDKEFSDWIEILNTSTSPANLNGYFLTDDAAQLDKWAFPSVDVPGAGR